MSLRSHRVVEWAKALPPVHKLAAWHKSRVSPTELDGVLLPPSSIRLGGHNFADDGDFLDSARSEARRLTREFSADSSTRILDIGCGVGRLPIGMLASGFESSRYAGVDVDLGSVRWCQRNVGLKGAEFIHLDIANARYNPSGSKIDGDFRLPLGDNSFDVVYLYSVFSHMESEDVRAYLVEYSRILAPGGGVFLTAFLEDGVEDVSVNPEGYGDFPGDWDGELHCVRFSRSHFEAMAEDAGFVIASIEHGQESDGQSAVYLKHAGGEA